MINDATYDILLLVERDFDQKCLKGFLQLLFEHCVIKFFIYEEPNTPRGQRCGQVLKSVTWNFGSKILIFVGNFCFTPIIPMWKSRFS